MAVLQWVLLCLNVVVASLSEAVYELPWAALTPLIQYKSIANSSHISFAIEFTDPKATWFAIAISPTNKMVNSPINSAVVFDATATSPAIYELGGYEPELIKLVENSSRSIQLHQASHVNGTFKIVFERPLLAATASDVTIDLTQSTNINWAYGYHSWPSYHHNRGSVSVKHKAPSVCNSNDFQNLPLAPLGESPLHFKSLVVQGRICLEVVLFNDTKATWLGISFSNTTEMVNSPFNNAVVYDAKRQIPPALYQLTGFDPEYILLLKDQSAINVHSASSVNGITRFTFERALAAVGKADVAIDLKNPKQIINWAYGHDQWPSYHEARGNAFVSLGQSVEKQSLCDTNWFIKNVTEEVLDPDGKFRIKRLLSNGQLCVKVLLNDPKATWFGISFAPKAQMVNEPVNNAVILDTTKLEPQVYALTGYEPQLIIPLQAPSYLLHSASSKDGNYEFTFQRQLNAELPTDVAIELEVNSVINWAYGYDAWPSYHHERGSAHITFHTFDLTSTITSDYGSIATPTQWILLGFAVWGAALGLIVTHCFGHATRRFLDKTLAAPPRFSREESFIDAWLWLPLSELKVGESIALLHYIGCLAAVFIAVENSAQRWSVTSGHLAVVHLVFLLLPVARGLYWEQLFFGTSFERVVKFHRILGRLFIVFAAVHLYTNAYLVNVLTATNFGSQQVIPLYGFIALVSFVVLGIFALPVVRRQAFELFYYTHRVAAIVGILFALLHARTVRIILIVPIAIYILSYIIRAKSLFHRYQASFTSYSDSTVSVVLKSTKTLEKVVPLGAYYWVAIPSISYLEWHPFSAIATTTEDGKPTFGFVIKALTNDGFVSRVREKLINQEASVLLSGPYGNLSLRLNEYSNVVLIAGGIGITPILHIFNELKSNSNITANLHWIVRNPFEFESTQYFMKWDAKDLAKVHLYADEVTESGRLILSGDLPIEYAFGRPRIDDLLKSYQGTRTCVIVCGPQGLAQFVQSTARAYDLPIHKETFLL